ncbi:MAG: (2Fe-2S)-binding protein [Gammaproteobacteria bacterium]|nr:(2Fe-2S)-binding protein [Gammaproteobacteria bacterium]
MPEAVIAELPIRLNGETVRVPAGITVAAALALAGQQALRLSVKGAPRGPLCGMGVCFECRVTIDGRRHERACQRLVADQMEILTHD